MLAFLIFLLMIYTQQPFCEGLSPERYAQYFSLWVFILCRHPRPPQAIFTLVFNIENLILL